MKLTKLIIVFLVVLIISMSSISNVFATIGVVPTSDLDKNEFNKSLQEFKTDVIADQVKTLEVLGLLTGTDMGLELDKGMTRAEGVTMYSRLMGLDYDIHTFNYQNKDYVSGFDDVPNWVKDVVNYLKNNNVVNGVSESKFGSNSEMTADQFTALVLRGLGYDDKKGDFLWNKSLEKAVEIGLVSGNEKMLIEKDNQFTREEMSIIAYNTLFAQNRNTLNTTLQYRASTLGNDSGVAQINFIELNSDEIREIEKMIANGVESTSEGNAILEKLYPKIADMVNKSSKLYKFEIDDKIRNVSIPEIDLLTYKDWGISASSPSTKEDAFTYVGIKYTKGVLTLYSDQMYLSSMSSKLVYEDIAKKYKLPIKDLSIGSYTKGIDFNYSDMRIDIIEIGKSEFGKEIIDNLRYKVIFEYVK